MHAMWTPYAEVTLHIVRLPPHPTTPTPKKIETVTKLALFKYDTFWLL